MVMAERIPRVCTFRGAREEVMNSVWEKARKLEAKGIPLSPEMFGVLVREEWRRVKQEAAKVCPIVSPEQIKMMLEELEKETRGAERRPVEIGVSVRAQQE
ncbi:MAG: hypothetical protein QXX57_03670 [Nitrososphaerota archaeon]